MITLSVAIMAHPKREAQVEHVLEMLGEDAPVIWDQINDRWDTGRRSMLAYNPECSHHLVIQDDTLLCRDLIAGVKKALEHVPDNAPLCLYMGRRRARDHFVVKAAARAEGLGASFVTMSTLNWGPGIAVPTHLIPGMIAYCDPLDDIPNYDRRLSRYWQLEAKTRVWYTWPSLLDHADGPSLVKGRLGAGRDNERRCRIAHHFLGEDHSALECDWTGPVIRADGSFKTGAAKEGLSLSVAVMAHPRRKEQVGRLLEKIGDVRVVWDERNNRWDTGRRAMLAYDPGCTHHLVIQDDAVACRDLIPGVLRVLEQVPPDSPVSLYLGLHKRIPEATNKAEDVDAAFISWEKLDHGLGIVVPTEYINPMLSHADSQTHIQNYDARLSTYFEQEGKSTWYTRPSLIDHAQGPSLVEGRDDMRKGKRAARWFVGEEASALGVDWTRPVVDADRKPVARPVKRSKTKLSVAVMAHPKREDMVGELVQRLDCPVPAVVWDRRGDRWDTGRRAMLSYDIDCTHHLVLQDDILVCQDIIEAFRRIAEVVPDNPVCGYMGRLRPAQDRVVAAVTKARETRASFITAPILWWGPAVMVPTAYILDMIGYSDEQRDILNYDRRLSKYFEHKGIRTWYTWPSLVDHKDGPSLVPGRVITNHVTSARVAHEFLGEYRSALSLDWTGPVVDLQKNGRAVRRGTAPMPVKAAVWNRR